jgi:hypothetical protein
MEEKKGTSGLTDDTGFGKGGSYADPTNDTQPLGTVGGAQPDVIDLNNEEMYWRQNFQTRPYVTEETSFIEYKPAYRCGAEALRRYPGKTFDQVEPELANEWDRFKGTSSLTWEKAKHAARDAWQRVSDAVERMMPGDSDRDGK